MGILVDDFEVLTAAHVVEAALGKKFDPSVPATVHLCFPFAGGAVIDGTVDPARWIPTSNDPIAISDIAVVRLSKAAPAEAGRAILLPHEDGVEARVYGFRSANGTSHPRGEWAEAKVLGPQPGGRAHVEGTKLPGGTIERGYSGAGVYLARRDAVIGMLVEVDVDPDRRVSQLIDTATLRHALGSSPSPGAVSGAPAPTSASKGRPHLDPSRVQAAQDAKDAVEEHLHKVALAFKRLTPFPDFLQLLRTVLTGTEESPHLLRAAFGLPEDAALARSLWTLLESREPSMHPVEGVLSQRVHHVLWRYEVTLGAIGERWSDDARAASEAVRSLCQTRLLWPQPMLADLDGSVQLDERLLRVAEPGPDTRLFGALRALDHSDRTATTLAPDLVNVLRAKALDYVHSYLQRLISGDERIEDSSNAWWATRYGMNVGDPRFDAMLPSISDKYSDVHVPTQWPHRVMLGEIHGAVRAVSYTLSNVQAILEMPKNLGDDIESRLHRIIAVMIERLLAHMPSTQLYIASVRHEGLRNYLDYVAQQSAPAKG